MPRRPSASAPESNARLIAVLRRRHFPRRAAAAGVGAAPGVLASDLAAAAGLTSAISSPSSMPSTAVRLSDWPITFTARGSNPSNARR